MSCLVLCNSSYFCIILCFSCFEGFTKWKEKWGETVDWKEGSCLTWQFALTFNRYIPVSKQHLTSGMFGGWVELASLFKKPTVHERSMYQDCVLLYSRYCLPLARDVLPWEIRGQRQPHLPLCLNVISWFSWRFNTSPCSLDLVDGFKVKYQGNGIIFFSLKIK